MLYNKEVINKKIEELEIAVEMEKHIRETIEKFKHYKLVNIKFVEALKEDGEYHAYINKDDYSTKLVIYKNGRDSNREEFSHYISHLMTKKLLTWDGIQDELVRYGYQKKLDDHKKMRDNFDEELKRFEEWYNVFEKTQFDCFQLYYIKRDIKIMLDYAKR